MRNGTSGTRLGSMCPHFVCPQVIVAEPGASGGDVHVENLLLGGVYCRVVNDQFGLGDRSCREEAAAGGEVLTLTAPSPGKQTRGGKEASINTHPTHLNRHYLFRVMLRLLLVVFSAGWRMMEPLTAMSISKASASSTSSNR